MDIIVLDKQYHILRKKNAWFIVFLYFIEDLSPHISLTIDQNI